MNIPKIIHLIWVGGEKPTKFDYLVSEIKRINFDYQVIEWNDNNINFQLINRKLFDETENLGSKSDILRFEILYKFGGIYLDYDFLQLKKFDDLLDYDFFAGTHVSCKDYVWNSLIGAKKESSVCLKFLNGLKNRTPIGKFEISRVMEETGPLYLTKIMHENNFNENIKIFIGDEFFPFNAEHRFKIKNLTQADIEFVKTFSSDKTYCIHLHTTTWQ